MITLVEALDFRCLRQVRQRLDAMHVLVGPNASGKTTFLDVVGFLGRLVAHGPEAAIAERTRNFSDLTWGRKGTSFELAIEARIPDDLRLRNENFSTIRYEVACRIDPQTGETGIFNEIVDLVAPEQDSPRQVNLFPNASRTPPAPLIRASESRRRIHRYVAQTHSNSVLFSAEVDRNPPERWSQSLKLGPRRSILANIPADESLFPASLWLQNLLVRGVQSIVLNSLLIRQASPPGQVQGFKPDGSNLPWVIAEFERAAPERFQDWLLHLNTALPDLVGIRVVERDDDRHRYLMLKYRGGLEVPSWTVSDGTLRLLALTLPAYLPDLRGVYLIEEPENGIHPRAVETMFQSLSSVYDAQILLATHSPVILGLASPDSILCFAKSEDGSTDIVLGREHPALQDWRGEVNLGVLFASGVLG